MALTKEKKRPSVMASALHIIGVSYTSDALPGVGNLLRKQKTRAPVCHFITRVPVVELYCPPSPSPVATDLRRRLAVVLIQSGVGV
jgi:hypothetical protein